MVRQFQYTPGSVSIRQAASQYARHWCLPGHLRRAAVGLGIINIPLGHPARLSEDRGHPQAGPPAEPTQVHPK